MRWSRVAQGADALVVLLLVVSGQVQAWTGDFDTGRTVHAVLVAAATAPLLVRRRHPMPVLAVVAVAAWLQYRLGAGLPQPFFALVLATYSVGARATRRTALVGLATTMALVLATDVPRLRDGEPWEDVVPTWVGLAAVWGFGGWMRSRRREIDRLTEETEALEASREAESRAAVAAERARIARELHDLVAHSMGIIVIQAQAAQRVLPVDPTAADEALRAIERSGRQGLAEMRRLLEVLVEGPDETPHGPQPGIRDVDALVAQVRAAGLPVEVCVEGDPRPLSPGAELSAYRIVQEALTNVLRHAGAATATLRLRYASDELVVEVVDDGAGTPSGGSSGGRGLIGMRERVAVFGGRLETGRLPDGGWRVLARLPLEPAGVTAG